MIHIGKNKVKTVFKIEDLSTRERRVLDKTISERDKGVIIREDLKLGDHVRSAAAKANRVIGMLKKTFVSTDSEIWIKLYVSFVRPQLEYAVQSWCPYLVMDIET